jgi:aminoglycoside phosphotransferase
MEMGKLYMKIKLICILFLAGCASEKPLQTLHNYPMLDPHNCPLPMDDYDNPDLKAQAKALNMRYVDYLHFVNNKKHETNLVLGE